MDKNCGTAELTIRKGSQVLSSITIRPDDQILTIGRHLSNDINLDDDLKVSRVHAVIVRMRDLDKMADKNDRVEHQQKYLLRDLGSATGTKVSGAFIRKKILQDGDEISISKYTLTIRLNVLGNQRKRHMPVDEWADYPLPDPSLGLQQTILDGTRRSGILLDSEKMELISCIERGDFNSDILNKPDDFSTAIMTLVGADRCLVGFLQGEEVSITYERGFGYESPHCTPQFLRSLHEKGARLQARALWLALPEQGFLAFLKSKAPAFTDVDLDFAKNSCELLLGRHNGEQSSSGHTPWQLSVVGLNGIKEHCREIALGTRKSVISDVLILGETGTGKDVLARFIHDYPERAKGSFVSVNCSALPKDLIHSELFGHEKGSFTGADTEKAGYFEMAQGGTLFLDEIGDLPENIQVALLTVLQERKIRRLGGTRTIKLDLRVMAATDRNIEDKMQADTFRRAIYERFPHKILVPPLRDRPHEIPLFAYYFLDLYSSKTGAISRDAFDKLRSYPWPGNVRELQNLIKSLIINEKEIIFSWDLPDHIRHARKISDYKRELQQTLKDIEKERIIEVLKETRGNVAEAIKILGISRGTLYNKINVYKLKIPRELSDTKE